MRRKIGGKSVQYMFYLSLDFSDGIEYIEVENAWNTEEIDSGFGVLSNNDIKL